MDIKSPTLQRFFQDWQTWRGTRAFPARSDVDPLSLRYILGNLSVVDVLRDPLRFFFRIQGTASVDRTNFDLTGKSLDVLPNETLRNIMHNNLVRALEKRAPLLIFHESMSMYKVFGHLEVLVVPFSSDQDIIDMLVIATHYDVPRRYWKQQSAAPVTPA
jgi:hypothetical protein